MKKVLDKLSWKYMIIIGAAAVLLIAAVIFFATRGKGGYRMIQVYELEGDASIERDRTGIMDAYVNLTLLDGDYLRVLADSFTRLKMDEDKFMLVEPESELQIYATGNSQNSKTDIDLKAGRVTVEIQNKLSSDSSYQVTTPNSVMAVRGTVFYVMVEMDENGRPVTHINVLEGTVTVQQTENGEVTEEEVAVEAGKGAIIADNNGEVEITLLDDIDYTEMSDLALANLYNISTGGRNLVLTTEEIEELMNGTEDEEYQVEETDSEEDSLEQEEESGEADTQSPGPGSTASPAASPSATPSPSSSPTPSPSSTPTPSPSPASSPGTGAQNQNEESAVYTVTFRYKGETFGTLSNVKKGATISKPKLQPAASGSWDFDFSKPITKDTVINFKTK